MAQSKTAVDCLLEISIAVIETEFSKAYALNDPGHRTTHCREVYECGLEINGALQLDYPAELILLAAWFHDLFAWSRQNHHELAATWVETTDYPLITKLSTMHRRHLAVACREHRASYKKLYSTIFSELIASANRKRPKPLEAHVQRAVSYHLFLGKELPEAQADAIRHLKEKYGTKGFANFPDMYRAVYEEQLIAFQSAVDTL